MKNKYTFAALAAFAFMFASPSWALPGPTSATFAKGAMFTVAGYAAGKDPLTGFPVLVRIKESSPQGFSYDDLQSKATGDDIAFVDMNGNGLPFEIDTWDTNSTSLIWVRLPSMQNGTEFVMCWGSSSSGKAVSSANPWSDYTGVWHMNDPGNGVTNVLDSTANHLDGTTVSSSTSKTDGKIGGARFITSNTTNTAGKPYDSGVTVDMTNDPEKLDAVNRIVPEFTASFWVRPQHSPQWWYFITRKASDFGSGWGLQQGADNDWKKYRAYGGSENDSGCLSLSDVIGLSQGSWTKVDAVWMSDKTFKIYMNGSLAKQGTLANQASNGDQTKLALGGALAPTDTTKKNGRGVYGDMDEIRLRAGALSENWIAADYATQTDASFLTPGTAEDYVENDNPHAAVTVASVAYTNVTLTANVLDLGGDATSAGVSVSVSTDNQFTTDVWHTEYSIEAADNRSFDILHLLTNTTYHVRLIAENPLGGGVTNTVSFTTRTPGVPAGTALFLERGFSTLSARATASSIGIGAESATMRLEASTDGFETIAASADVAATLNEQVELVVSNLTPGTEYALRVRIRNDWGIDTYIELPSAYTRTVPFATTGIGWTFSQDGSTINITLGISDVYDGATGSATLTYNGADKGAKEVTGATTLTWPGINTASGSATATVVLSAMLDDQTYSQTFSVNIAPGSTVVAVSDFTEHQSAETSVRVRVGDVITLPELTGTASYTVMNKRILSSDGNVFVAIEPGVVGVKCIDNLSNTNVLAVIVLPDAVGNGSVYIYKETVSTGDRIWTNANAWEKVGTETNDSWPKNADDIAVIPFYQYTGEKYLRLTEDVAIGGLYYGQFLDATNDKLTIERHKNSSTKTVSFERTDGEPAIVKICANTTENRQNELKFGGYEHSTAYLSDTVLDAGWDGSDNANCHGRFASAENNTNTIPAGVTVSVVNFDRTGYSVGATMWPGHLKGAGLFWNRSSGTMRWDGGLANFTGTIRDSGGYMNASTDRCGPTYLRTGACTNVAVEVIGQVGRSGGSPYTSWAGNAVGCLKVGLNHSYGAEPQHPETNWFPRTLTLHGGTMYRDPAGVKWGAGAAGGVRDLRCTKRLTVEGGLNNIGGTGGDNAIPWFEADELVHGDKATIRIVDHSRANTASTATTTNHVTILHGVSAYLVGAAGNPEESDVYPIVPWMVAPITAWDDSWDRYPFFACFDDNDRLIRPVCYDTALGAAASEKSNAYVSDKTIQIDHDVTLNSLFLLNQNKNKWLGEGRTLTLTSGGLVLRNSSSSIGLPGRTDNGSLVLGDSTHPGYVFAKSSNDSQPNQIWADVTAPGGFVAAYTGYLTLGGDQTGIGDEIAVNAGSLQLGTADNSCQLAKDLPIRIYANATLKLPNASSTTGNILKFDGAAGWFGKVEVPEGVAAKCCKAYWRDYPETPEWQPIRRGVYTGDEATALSTGAIYDPDHFSGAGTVAVLKDNSTLPLLIIVR